MNTTKIRTEIIEKPKHRYRVTQYHISESRWNAEKQIVETVEHEEYWLEQEVRFLGFLFKYWKFVSSGRWFGICEYDYNERIWFDDMKAIEQMIKYLES